MLGKKFFGSAKKEPQTKADKAVRSRLAKLEGKVLSGRDGVDVKTVKRVEKLELTLDGVKKRVNNMQPPLSSQLAKKLATLDTRLSRVSEALVKLPKGGEAGGLVVKVSRLEKEVEDLAGKLEEQTKFLVSLYGVKGDNGRVGQLERVATRLEEKVDKVAWLHYKLLGMALAGGVIGGFLAKYLL